MAVAWFLVPYKRVALNGHPSRTPAINDFTAAIRQDGGDWAEAECLGNHAVVKVRASAETLTLIAGAAGVIRLPKSRLDDPLSDLTTAQRDAIRTKLLSLGYTTAEIRNALSNDLRSKTLRDVLRFALTRSLTPRYDAPTDTIVLDGPVLATKPLELVDAEIGEG